MSDLIAKLEFAARIAREAGEETLRWFARGHLDLRTKPNGTPVTAADLASETLLRERIAANFPTDGILGEELGEQPGSSGDLWILDPIDGTKSFARGVPLYGTLVGLEREGRAVVGAAAFPALGEMMYAAEGLGAYWVTGMGSRRGEERRPARVSTVARWDEALFSFTSPGGFARAGLNQVLHRFQERAALTRGWSDCYGHMLVATGRAEVMLDPLLAAWDAAALAPILREAGGSFTDLAGISTHRGGSGLSTNGLLLADALEMCR